MLEGYIHKDKDSMLEYINKFLELPKYKQREFQLARRMCYNVDYTNMSYMNENDMRVIRNVIKNVENDDEWEEILRRYLRRYI